ncbi:MAG: hypothetical protein LBL57_04765 [Tannerella sp.]|jgi:hypothetical protein|nr:hypothetical protein [Tannerella sp.]
MNIQIRIKAAGRRKTMLELHTRILPDGIDSVEKLIAGLVLENVREYNAKAVDVPFFRYLSQREYEDALYTGKVAFGDRRNEQQQDEQQAVDNAIQCFRDGLYRILINECEVMENAPFELKEGDILTFIRLTMLAGRRF